MPWQALATECRNPRQGDPVHPSEHMVLKLGGTGIYAGIVQLQGLCEELEQSTEGKKS